MSLKLILITGLLLVSLIAWKTSAIAGTSEVTLPLPFRPNQSICRDFLQRNDIAGVRDCDTTEAGMFGEVAGRTFYYVIYCIIPDYSSEPGTCGDQSFLGRYYRKRGLGIFVQERAGQQARLFLERGDPDIGQYLYQKPAIVKNRFGTFLHVPISVDGTGNFNESEYYIWDSKSTTWKVLDTTTWLSELEKRVPTGLSINKGIWPDLEAMTAEADLYKKKDANGSPTGVAVIQLTLDGLQFRIQALEFRRYKEQ